MKRFFAVCCFLLSCFGLLYGQTPKSGAVYTGYREGTVVAVERGVGRSHTYRPGTNQADAPLISKVYTYEISVRVDCDTYFVRYESASDNLPATISPNQRTRVRVAKHSLYFDRPGDEELKMPIVSRKTNREGKCAAAVIHSSVEASD